VNIHPDRFEEDLPMETQRPEDQLVVVDSPKCIYAVPEDNVLSEESEHRWVRTYAAVAFPVVKNLCEQMVHKTSTPNICLSPTIRRCTLQNTNGLQSIPHLRLLADMDCPVQAVGCKEDSESKPHHHHQANQQTPTSIKDTTKKLKHRVSPSSQSRSIWAYAACQSSHQPTMETKGFKKQDPTAPALSL
jgi:hypothetical protein